MKKQILLSLGMVVFVGAVAAGATGAFFTDTAVATGNTFTAGSLDLKISKTSAVSGFADTKNSTWNFSAMAPGGTPETDTLWLKNSGSVDGMHLGLVASNSNTGTTPNPAPQVRITEMTVDGSNVLEDGAGAYLSAYVAPATCTVTVSGSGLLIAINAAVSGDIICVDTGSYGTASYPVVASNVTIVGLNDPSGANAASVTGQFSVTGDNVAIRGLNITNPTGSYGVSISGGAEGITVTENLIHDIGTSLAEGSAQAISVQNGASGGTGYTFTENQLYDIGNTSLIKGAGSGSSAKGIYLGDTGAAGVLDSVTVENNVIRDVYASVLPWNGNLGGRGAYGILAGVNAGVTNLVVKNNSIYDLEGLWVHAVGLEQLTTGASVTYNDIHDLTNHKLSNDSAGVMIEANTGSGIVIQHNNLVIAFGVVQATAGGSSVNAKFNWWGDWDPSDQVFTVGGSINTNSHEGGPVAGFVNGNDFNGNGFADLQDLANDPITDIEPGLDAGEVREFVMSVQYDGPTTDNTFQGAQLTSDLTFTLSQQ